MKYPTHILLDMYDNKSTLTPTNLKKKKQTNVTFNTNLLFDVNFLKKEFIYTKLKYSRCPQYDIVSGGVAALFAGFIGFLVSEKFGLELVDSGDFYVLFMYVVFLSLIGSVFLKIIDRNTTFTELFSMGWFLNFYKNLIIMFLRLFKQPVKRLKSFTDYIYSLFWYLEYVRYTNYMFWRLLKFLEYYPKNKF